MALAMADAKVMTPVSSPVSPRSANEVGMPFADTEEEYSGFSSPAEPKGGFLDELSRRVSQHSNDADDIESRLMVQRNSGSFSQPPDPLQAELDAKLKRRSTRSPDAGPDPGGGTSSSPAVRPTPEKTPPPTKSKPRPMSGAYGFGADDAGSQPSSPGMGPLLEVSAGAGLAGAMNSTAGLNAEFVSARAATLQRRAVKLGANGTPAAADAAGAADLVTLTAAGLQL